MFITTSLKVLFRFLFFQNKLWSNCSSTLTGLYNRLHHVSSSTIKSIKNNFSVEDQYFRHLYAKEESIDFCGFVYFVNLENGRERERRQAISFFSTSVLFNRSFCPDINRFQTIDHHHDNNALFSSLIIITTLILFDLSFRRRIETSFHIVISTFNSSKMFIGVSHFYKMK